MVADHSHRARHYIPTPIQPRELRCSTCRIRVSQVKSFFTCKLAPARPPSTPQTQRAPHKTASPHLTPPSAAPPPKPPADDSPALPSCHSGDSAPDRKPHPLRETASTPANSSHRGVPSDPRTSPNESALPENAPGIARS